MNGTRRVVISEVSNANAKMVKMAIRNGKNLATGHTKEHHGQYPIQMPFNVNQLISNHQPAGQLRKIKSFLMESQFILTMK